LTKSRTHDLLKILIKKNAILYYVAVTKIKEVSHATKPRKYNDKTDLKIKALTTDIRRTLLGLIFSNGPMYQSEILKHIKIDSNKLAYHLNMLYRANLIDRSYKRHGRNFSKYWIKEDGEKFLDFIGAKKELKKLSNGSDRLDVTASKRFQTASAILSED
jgi:DNA-binding HxlR family transcriptional regulator